MTPTPGTPASSWAELYDADARERWVDEPVKRVRAPERTPFERDRARVVHAASLRRLAAKTQVLGPGVDDFVRNRLTHSLEVAQVARDLAHPLGCHPDLAETAALAHDLGHPPFGHNGETALDELGAAAGGFEGNAQTLRILTRLEAKSFDAEGRSVGLNLTRATLDACTKYPWPRRDAPSDQPGKYGVYDDDRPVFGWLRTGVEGARRSVEAQVMDVADDIAYSVHDLEDGVVLGGIDLARLDDPGERAAVFATVRELYLPGVEEAALEEALARVRAVGSWPDTAYDGSRRALASLKNLTSDLIGVFCGEVHRATVERHGPGPLVRHGADLVVPDATLAEVSVLKGVAAHYVMRSQERLGVMERQRELVSELYDALVDRGPDVLDPALAADFHDADDERGRTRVLLDQLASLTDASAVAWHHRLCR